MKIDVFNVWFLFSKNKKTQVLTISLGRLGLHLFYLLLLSQVISALIGTVLKDLSFEN